MKVFATLVIVFAGFSLAGMPTAFSDSASEKDRDALRDEIESLKDGQKAIREDLKAIRELLSGRQKAAGPVKDVKWTIKVADDPAKGKQDATVTLIEFTDYQCPFCSRHSNSVLPQIEKDFVETGKIQYVLRDFPLASLHPDAAKAHEAAHCAGEQGKYWEMHDQLFAHQRELQAEKLAAYAATATVADAPAFQACLDSGKYAGKTNASVREGTEVGVRGTPSFLLGHREPDGTVKAVKLIRGALPFPLFQKEINALLNPQKTDRRDPTREQRSEGPS